MLFSLPQLYTRHFSINYWFFFADVSLRFICPSSSLASNFIFLKSGSDDFLPLCDHNRLSVWITVMGLTSASHGQPAGASCLLVTSQQDCLRMLSQKTINLPTMAFVECPCMSPLEEEDNWCCRLLTVVLVRMRMIASFANRGQMM